MSLMVNTELFLTGWSDSRFFGPYLKIPEPDAIVGDVKSHDVVDERLALGMIPRRAEGLHQQLLHERVVWMSIKGGVKRQDGARGLQTVARHLQLGHGVDVLHQELG